ncbi:hypothetical protein LINPERHAP2_LOCUS33635 [Linum perenne]
MLFITSFRSSTSIVIFNFFSGLPCLENLWLDGVHNNDKNYQLKTFRIFGLRLRTLNISCNQLCRIAMNAPNLNSFIFHNFYRLVEFTEMDVSSLDHVDVLIEDESLVDDVFIRYARYIINFFTELGNVESFVLCSTTFKILRCISEPLKDEPSPFTRLETLTFDVVHKDDNKDEDEEEVDEVREDNHRDED